MEAWAGTQELTARIWMLYSSRAREDVWEFRGEHGVQTCKPWLESFLTILRRTDAAHEEPIYQPPEARSKIAGRKLMPGKIGCRRREWQRVRWLQCITDSKVLGLNKTLGIFERQVSPGFLTHKNLTNLTRAWQTWVTEQHQKIRTGMLGRWFRLYLKSVTGIGMVSENQDN